MSKVLISGSIAYDHVMTYNGLFKDSLTGTNLDALSVSFLAQTHEVHFGGCAGNIAYNMRLLGLEPLIIGAVGDDYEKYRVWLAENGIGDRYVYRVPNKVTASAFIITDEKENQVTIFSPAAMSYHSDEISVANVVKNEQVELMVIAPDSPDRMKTFVRECQDHNVPYVFDPGQNTALFKPEELDEAISGAKVVIANDFEVDLMCKALGVNREGFAQRTNIFVETLGENGCEIHENGESERLEAVKPSEVLDPTGCGDAFRAGLVRGLLSGVSVAEGCRMGAVIATYNIERKGTQNHSFTMREFSDRLNKAYSL